MGARFVADEAHGNLEPALVAAVAVIMNAHEKVSRDKTLLVTVSE